MSAATPTKKALRRALDWGSLAPLRLRSRLAAEGVYAGSHKSARRGSGIEFGGHREYAPGDDLRWLDRRSLLRHDRLLVRQFETETDRGLRLVVDATGSMGYRGGSAPGAKLAFAALVAAALSRISLANGDPVGLAFIGGRLAIPGPVAGGRDAFERVLGSLEAVEPGGQERADATMLDRALGALSRSARRGSVIVVLSDLLDLPEIAADRISAIATRGRAVIVVRVLDPDEQTLPFEGAVRLKSMEGNFVVETDASLTRERYLAALGEQHARWDAALVRRGGRLVLASSADDPVRVVRAVLAAAR